MFITTADFVEDYQISLDDFREDRLTKYISVWESKYLQDLLGVELYDLFVASIVASLPTGIYLTIYNALAFDDTHGGVYTGGILSGGMEISNKIVRSEGIKEMLKGFIFYEYTRDQPVFNTVTGNVQNVNENSINLNAVKAGICEKYNKAIVSYNAIQVYIKDHLSHYSTFNGVKKEPIYF